jgi:5-methylcytosine-specific restriction enzyme A
MTAAREAWHAWYGTSGWKKRRRHQLMLEPTCRFCAGEGRLTPAEVVDHIEPVKGDQMRFAFGAIQSLCKHCHESRKRVIERRGYDTAIDADGLPFTKLYDGVSATEL